MELLRQVELLAPQLVRAHPLIAGRRVLKLADRCAAEQRADSSMTRRCCPTTSRSTSVESMHWTGWDWGTHQVGARTRVC